MFPLALIIYVRIPIIDQTRITMLMRPLLLFSMLLLGKTIFSQSTDSKKDKLPDNSDSCRVILCYNDKGISGFLIKQKNRSAEFKPANAILMAPVSKATSDSKPLFTEVLTESNSKEIRRQTKQPQVRGVSRESIAPILSERQ